MNIKNIHELLRTEHLVVSVRADKLISFRLITVTCSHGKSYEFYADSIYNKMSMLGVECPSWLEFLLDKCTNNTKMAMGHDTHSR